MARGFGERRLMVFPEEELIGRVYGTGNPRGPNGHGEGRELISRILPAFAYAICSALQ
jgi:hypothetical protein